MAERVDDFRAINDDDLEEVAGGTEIRPLSSGSVKCPNSNMRADYDHIWDFTGNKRSSFEGDPNPQLEFRCRYCGKTKWE